MNMVSEAGGVKDFSSASHPPHSPPALEQHCRSFYILNREGMDLLGGEEALHYYWMEAMRE